VIFAADLCHDVGVIDADTIGAIGGPSALIRSAVTP